MRLEEIGTKHTDKIWHGYRFTEDGKLYNKDGSLKLWATNQKGYPLTNFYVEGKSWTRTLHRIVAELWYGPCPVGYEVDHIDDDRTNFRPDNLRYVTKSENNQKSYDSGNRVVSGERNANARLTEEKVREIRRKHAEGVQRKFLAQEYGVEPATINNIVSRRLWKNVE